LPGQPNGFFDVCRSWALSAFCRPSNSPVCRPSDRPLPQAGQLTVLAVTAPLSSQRQSRPSFQRQPRPLDPFHNFLAPALFDCASKRMRSVANLRSPECGARRNFGRGLNARPLTGGTPLGTASMCSDPWGCRCIRAAWVWAWGLPFFGRCDSFETAPVSGCACFWGWTRSGATLVSGLHLFWGRT
jgi:hypothetical protein